MSHRSCLANLMMLSMACSILKILLSNKYLILFCFFLFSKVLKGRLRNSIHENLFLSDELIKVELALCTVSLETRNLSATIHHRGSHREELKKKFYL